MLIIYELPDLDKLASKQKNLLAKKTREEIVAAYDEATSIAFDAYDANTDKKFLDMAKKALKISPFCTEAYNIFASFAPTPETCIEFLSMAMNGARVYLGEDFFDKHAGNFWKILETRPFMRAMAELIYIWKEIGEREKAISGCQEMLRLCPNDNVGIRETLMCLLIQAGKYGEAETLYEKYSEDWLASWPYARVLLDFIASKSSTELDKNFKIAVKRNGRIAKYLTGKKKLPLHTPPAYTMGSEEEAVYTADMLVPAWKSVPGAVEWLAINTPGRRRQKKENKD